MPIICKTGNYNAHPRQNRVHISGFLAEEPYYYPADEYRQRPAYLLRVTYCRKDMAFGDLIDRRHEFVTVSVYCETVEECSVASTLHKYDFIDFFAVLFSSHVVRKYFCANDECRHSEVPFESSTSDGGNPSKELIVRPRGGSMIVLYRKGTEINSKEDAERLAVQYRERNEFCITGSCANIPREFTAGKQSVTQFLLAVNRSLRIYGDEDDSIDADYIWVKCHGENSRLAKECLHTGTTVQLEGCLYERTFDYDVVCPNCGNRRRYSKEATEFVPHLGGVDLLANYNTEVSFIAMPREKKPKKTVTAVVENAFSPETEETDSIWDD